MKKLIFLAISIMFLYSWTFSMGQQHLTFKAKERIANQILHRLFQAIGAPSLKKCPTLQIDQHSGSPFYYHKGRVIYLSEQWIDVCLNDENIGETGLAIILAHELHHFFQKEKGAFYGSWPKDSQAKERDADKFGLFYCYLAGYKNIDNIHPVLLRAVYQTFELDKASSSYPTLFQRIQSDDALRRQIKEAYHLFKVATYLTLNGQYHKALLFYQQLESWGFMTKEIYNNYGMTQAMNKLTNINGSWAYLAYPFEIAYHSPLLIELSRSTTIKKLNLPNAIALFQQALIQDTTYEPAILNLLTAYAAGGDLDNFHTNFLKYQLIIENNQLMKEKIELARIICEFNQTEPDKTIRGQTINHLMDLETRSNLTNKHIISANITALQSPNSTIQTIKAEKVSVGTRWDCLDYSLPNKGIQRETINIGVEYLFNYYEASPYKTIYQLQWLAGYEKDTYVHQIHPQALNCEIIQNRSIPMVSPYYLFGEYFSLHPFHSNVIIGSSPNSTLIRQTWYSF